MVFLLALLGCFGSSNSSTISRGPSEKIWMKTDSDYLVANGKDFVTLSSNVDNPTFYYFLKGKEEGKKLSGSTFSIIEPGDYEIIVKHHCYHESNPEMSQFFKMRNCKATKILNKKRFYH